VSGVSAYGLRIDSALPLPELPESEGEADVVVRLGRLDDRELNRRTDGGTDFTASENDFCFRWEGIGTFSISAGSEIVVDPAPAVHDGLLREFLLGPVLAVVLQQRGLLVLHGSTVEIDGAAVVFLGGPGWGKSTLAAALHARGHGLVADDVTAVGFDADGPVVRPAYPQLRLWPDSVRAVGDDPAALPRLRPELEKRARPVAANLSATRLPLRQIYVLRKNGAMGAKPLPPQDAVIELVRHTYAVGFLADDEVRAAHLRQCGEACAHARTRRLTTSSSLQDLSALADLVERDIR
jgi:HPr Serine kinase C-terminal domain